MQPTHAALGALAPEDPPLELDVVFVIDGSVLLVASDHRSAGDEHAATAPMNPTLKATTKNAT
jgi:hypothetical protein